MYLLASFRISSFILARKFYLCSTLLSGGITLGDGEWQARKHGVQGRRQWRKVQLAMDTTTSDNRALEFTSSSDGDSPVLPELLDQIPEGEEISTVLDIAKVRTSATQPPLPARAPHKTPSSAQVRPNCFHFYETYSFPLNANFE